MSLNIFFGSSTRTGTTLAFSIERLSDGFCFDFSDSQFKDRSSVAGTNYRGTLSEGTAEKLGTWKGSITSTPEAQFSDGTYYVRVHNTADADMTLAPGEVEMKNSNEVRQRIDILETVGEDSAGITVHQKLGDLSDEIAASASVNVALSILPGEFLVIADLEKTGTSTSDSALGFPVLEEHAKRWTISVKTLAGVALDLTNTVIRFVVAETKGQSGTIRLDYKSSTDTSKVSIYDPTNGKFRITIDQADTDAPTFPNPTTGGDGAGLYPMELLWDRNNNGTYELLVSGTFTIGKGVDIVPS